jgi:hypothetical protein
MRQTDRAFKINGKVVVGDMVVMSNLKIVDKFLHQGAILQAKILKKSPPL